MNYPEVQAITESMYEKVPVFIWGPPGVGKSALVHDITKRQGIGLIDLKLLLLYPTDLRGMPAINRNDKGYAETVWTQPTFLPNETRDGKRGILFLDELSSVTPTVQAAAQQLVLERRCGEYFLPAGWSVVAAGNRITDRAAVYKMVAPLANRFLHLELAAAFEPWKKWAFDTSVHEDVIAFLAFKSNLLHNFDPQRDDRAFPSPRSWDFVSRVLYSVKEPDLQAMAAAGCVGDGAASELMAFRRVRNKLPDIDAVLEGRVKDVPTETDVLYALCTSLTSRIITSKDMKHVTNVLEYSMNMMAEFAAMMVKDLFRHIQVDRSPAFGTWVKKYSKFVVH